MMQTMKRGLAWLLVLIMLAAFVPTLILTASAAEVTYVYDGKYIYNWGTRGTVATFLSPNAEEFYEDNDTSYAELSALSGGTGKSNAPSSALYRELQSLMKSAHTHQTSYAETRDLYKYTDCQNNGGKISSFYSGTAIGPAWGQGNWNREHTWPNSKGLGGNDENDIMMLRPTSTSENSSRGNTAYGQSSGYYNPNSESNGNYDLRGDTARIFLYVYVRWGNTGNYAWGKSGVMESVEVLLEWMEEDPVDTWELGRNDSVESITGTRNVFVDYPELAFLLFGEEVPADMQTPSGGADNDCGHNNFGTGVVTAPTCTQKGYTTYTCKTAGCGYSYKTDSTNALGHSYVGGTCSACGEAEPSAPADSTYATEVTVGKAYKLGMFSTAKDSTYFFTGKMSGYYGATDTAFENGVDLFVEQATGGYYLCFKNESGIKQYISLVHVVNNGKEHYNFVFNSTPNSVFTWDTAKYSFKTTVNGQDCYIGTYGNYVTMSVLQTSKLGDDDYFARLYATESSSTSCKHTNTKIEGAITATCSTEGHTGKTVCTDCNTVVDEGRVISVAHVYAAWGVVRKATCSEAGLERRDCELCSGYETREISKIDHVDANGDNVCDVCEESTHTCEEIIPVLKAWWTIILNFFRRLFGQPELCPCGEIITKKN